MIVFKHRQPLPDIKGKGHDTSDTTGRYDEVKIEVQDDEKIRIFFLSYNGLGIRPDFFHPTMTFNNVDHFKRAIERLQHLNILLRSVVEDTTQDEQNDD